MNPFEFLRRPFRRSDYESEDSSDNEESACRGSGSVISTSDCVENELDESAALPSEDSTVSVALQTTQVYLGTCQGRIGMANAGLRDHGINGCTMLCSLIASSFLVGICSMSLINFIIDELSQKVIPLIRKKDSKYEDEYSYIDVKSAFNGLCDFHLFKVGLEKLTLTSLFSLPST